MWGTQVSHTPRPSQSLTSAFPVLATRNGSGPLSRSSTLPRPPGQGPAPRSADVSALSPHSGSVLSEHDPSHTAHPDLSFTDDRPLWTRRAFSEASLPEAGRPAPVNATARAPLLLSTPALTEPPTDHPRGAASLLGSRGRGGVRMGAQAVPGLCHKMADTSLSFERRKPRINSEENLQKTAMLPSSNSPSPGTFWPVLSGWQTQARAIRPAAHIAPSALGQPASRPRPSRHRPWLSSTLALRLRERGTQTCKKIWV